MSNLKKFISSSSVLTELIDQILIENRASKTKRQFYLVMATQKAANLFKAINLLDSKKYT